MSRFGTLVILVFVFIFILSFAGTLRAQPAGPKPGGSTICCNNFVVYATELEKELTKRCSGKPEIVGPEVGKFVKAIADAPADRINVRPCVGTNPVITLHQGPVRAEGCYPIKKLLPVYVDTIKAGEIACGVTSAPITPPPCPEQCCGDVILLINNVSNGGGGDPNPMGGTKAPPVVDSVAPSIPVETVVGISIHQSHRPSDTRAASVQLPVMMTDDGAFGAVSVNLSPIRLLQAEDGFSNKEVKMDRYDEVLSGLKLSFAAARTPEIEAKAVGVSTRSAAAITFDFRNDRSPLSNQRLRDCLNGKAVEIAPKIVGGLQRSDSWKLAKDELKSCFKSAALAYGLGLGISSDAGRLWWAHDLTYGIHGFTTHLGQWFADHQGFNPSEGGTRYSLSTQYFTASIDGALQVLAIDTIDTDPTFHLRARVLAGGSLTVSLFNGLTATAGARVAPPAWDAVDKEYDLRGIFSIGWGGADLITEYYRGRLGRAIEEKQRAIPQ